MDPVTEGVGAAVRAPTAAVLIIVLAVAVVFVVVVVDFINAVVRYYWSLFMSCALYCKYTM